MMRTRSRHRATARSRFAESSQNPPSASSVRVISTIALTATRPARRRSRSASPIRNPSTRSALVLHEPPALERERPSPERLREVRLVRREHDRRATGPDVAQRAQDLVLHRLVEVARRLVGEEERGLAHDRAGERRALSLPLRELRGGGLRAGREADVAGHVDESGPPQVLESFSSRRRLTMPGLALPRVAFMTWPTRALAAAVLPRL